MPLSSETILSIREKADPELVDAYHLSRETRLEWDHRSADEKECEDALKAELIRRMLDKKSGVLSSFSRMARLNTKEVPTPKDWNVIREYVIANDAWELIQQRLSVTGCTDHWEQGEVIPGVEKFETYSVSVSKL